MNRKGSPQLTPMSARCGPCWWCCRKRGRAGPRLGGREERRGLYLGRRPQTCWEQWGTGGKVEKHETYFEGRNLGCHLILMEKPLLWQRSLTPVYDIRLLTAFKPQLSLFPLYPSAANSLSAPSLSEGERVKLSKPGNSHAGSIPDRTESPELSPFFALSASQTCLSGLPCSPQRPQLFNPKLFVPSWYVEAIISLHIWAKVWVSIHLFLQVTREE